MVRRHGSIGIALALAGALAGSQAVATAPSGAGQTESGIAYLSGGVGSDERQRMEELAAGFNLRVEMADPEGKFQGGGHVRIRDAAGKTVLDTTTNGPLLYAKLPPGRYTIVVGDGPEKTRSVEVGASGRTDVVIDAAQR
jgi:hypothetical protein